MFWRRCMKEKKDMLCLSSIKLSDPIISGKSVKSEVTLKKTNGDEKKFSLIIKYESNVKKEHLPLIRMAFCMPLLNYGLFSKKFILDFQLSKSDVDILQNLNVIFSRDIFVNKIAKRRADFILHDYLPKEEEIDAKDGEPKAAIEPTKIVPDEHITNEKIDSNKCGILSSGGKESLLTYGILREIGAEVYPLYVNESGGHWRTALSAYKYHKRIDENTRKIWTNIDRFYLFMLDNLEFIRPDHRKVRADTYPLRLCIFPFYVFSLLPVFVDQKIGNLLLGSEFDDLLVNPSYKGITHYFGVYDQHQDYDIVMNNWYSKRIPGMYQWSAMRNISGLIVERILVSRYPHLAEYQRSCHSCHFENGKVVPCGKCSKCMGILLFLLANKADPRMMNYREKDILDFSKRVKPSSLRLDQDEKNQSFYLMHNKGNTTEVKPVDHVEKIHIYRDTCDIELVPKQFREGLMKIFEKHTTGYCKIEREKWVPLDKIKISV